MKTACVLGFGKSGVSATRFLLHLGYRVHATDDVYNVDNFLCNFDDNSNIFTSLPDEIEVKNFDFLVSSPGIKKTHPLIEKFRKNGIEVFCDIELAFRFMQNTNQKVVGITGTNGKTTTTLLVEHMLNKQNIFAKACGNIGVPFCDVLLEEKKPQVYVLELSSYQLETITTKKLDIAAILNISLNHLDWHESFDEYKKAKFQIAEALKKDGFLLLPHDLEYNASAARFDIDGRGEYCFLENKIVIHGKEVMQINKETLLFDHDRKNYIAALAIVKQLGVLPATAKEAFFSFKKPNHRIQFVKEVEGIAFYDDSKATNLDAVKHAVLSFSCPVILIAGGLHKGSSYSEWIPIFQNIVKCVVAYGQARDIIANDLQESIPTYKAASFEEAVYLAKSYAKRGDVVLLSPGASSLDQFKSYEERGIFFQTLVKSL